MTQERRLVAKTLNPKPQGGSLQLPATSGAAMNESSASSTSGQLLKTGLIAGVAMLTLAVLGLLAALVVTRSAMADMSARHDSAMQALTEHRDGALNRRDFAIQERDEARDLHRETTTQLNALSGEHADLQAKAAELETQAAEMETRAEEMRTQAAEMATDLTELRADRNELASDLKTVAGELDDARFQHAALSVELFGTQTDLTNLQSRHDGLTDRSVKLKVERDTARAENTALSGKLTNMQTDLTNLQRENDGLSDRADRLEISRDDARKQMADALSRLSALQLTVGSAEDLRTRANNLRAEISEMETEIEGLKKKREPLMLAPDGTTGLAFACTGSMEPAITCLDSGTGITDIRPEDIVVGAIIWFTCYPDSGQDARPIHAIHRVVEVKIEDGVHYYRAKGDANSYVDKCWIPESGVHGYLTAIERNTRPEHAALRDGVNGARVAFRRSIEAYGDVIEQACGHRDAANCAIGDAQLYAEALAAHARHIEAFDIFNCWLDNARKSERAGHIPHECPKSGTRS